MYFNNPVMIGVIADETCPQRAIDGKGKLRLLKKSSCRCEIKPVGAGERVYDGVNAAGVIQRTLKVSAHEDSSSCIHTPIIPKKQTEGGPGVFEEKSSAAQSFFFRPADDRALFWRNRPICLFSSGAALEISSLILPKHGKRLDAPRDLAYTDSLIMRNHAPSSEQSQESTAPQRPLPLPQQDGVLVLDKPGGLTSAACIARIKRRFSQKKIGHAGTLDPMATGVLLVLLGQATKISGHLMDTGDKIYSGVIRLGLVTDTWDAEGRIMAEYPVSGVDETAVRREMAALTGTYEQDVPAYSAAKHQGRPLYALARKGVETPVKRKLVHISRGEAELVGPERIRFRVTCSSGTYIRSLAHSLGNRLGCGGMLEKLTREYSHPFGIAQAHPLQDVLDDPDGFPSRVAGIADALPGWPTLRLSSGDAAGVRRGTRPAYRAEDSSPFVPGMRALLQDPEGNALALAETAIDNKSGLEVWALVRGLWNP